MKLELQFAFRRKKANKQDQLLIAKKSRLNLSGRRESEPQEDEDKVSQLPTLIS